MSTEGISPALNETTVWHEVESSKVASLLDVDPAQGLSEAEATKRLEEVGPNSLDQTEEEPAWHAFLREYKD